VAPAGVGPRRRQPVEGGELGALLDLLPALDRGHAAAVALTDTALQGSLPERNAGINYDTLLAMQTKATYTERGRLQRLAQLLRKTPHLRAAYHQGLIGTGQLHTIATEAKTLRGEALAAFDACFADQEKLARLEPDRLIDLARVEIDRLRPDLAQRRETRTVERSYVHLQPCLDGSGEGHFAYDADSFASLVAAIDTAAGPPTSDRPNRDGKGTAGEGDGDADWFDPIPDRPRAHQRADGLLALCEAFLNGNLTDHDSTGGTAASGPAGSVAPDGRATNAGDGVTEARAGTNGVTGTGRVVGRGGHHPPTHPRSLTLGPGGSAAPCEAAPGRVRSWWSTSPTSPATTARPDGPPGCCGDSTAPHPPSPPPAPDGSATTPTYSCCSPTATPSSGSPPPPPPSPPASVKRSTPATKAAASPAAEPPSPGATSTTSPPAKTAAHTIIENLVALCRRHHTAITTGRWTLTMTADGTVTLRRGRITHTTDPPLHLTLAPD
jgi:hypothetical protein